MEAVVLLFAALVIATVIPLIVKTVNEESKRRRRGMQAAATRYGGRIQESFWSGDSLRFEVDGVPAELTYFGGSDNAPPWTKVHFRWSAPNLRVAPEGTWASVKKFFGAEDIQIGNARFDDAFLIQGGRAWAREALKPELRGNLWDLYQLGTTSGFFGRKPGINLDVGPTGVVLKCFRNHVRTPEDLLAFLKLSTKVLKGLRKALGEDSVPISVSEVVKAGKCPVCSDGSGSLSKRCRGCNSAYHRDCWDYLGGCAVFGCEDRYRPEGVREQGW